MAFPQKKEFVQIQNIEQTKGRVFKDEDNYDSQGE